MAPWAIPTAWAATPRREWSSVPSATREPLALGADEVPGRDAHVVEDRLAGRRALDAELVLELADAEAGAVGLDDEGGEPPRLAVGDREHDVEVGDAEVGDPVLGAVDHPLVAVAARGGDHAAGVGAGLGLGQREGGRPLAARAARQDALLELVGAEQADRERAELLHHQDQRGRGAGLGDLLDRDVEHQRAGAGAAVLLLERQPEQVLLGEQLAQVPRVLGLGVNLACAGRDPFAHDLADRVAEGHMVVGERVRGVSRGARGHGGSVEHPSEGVSACLPNGHPRGEPLRRRLTCGHRHQHLPDRASARSCTSRSTPTSPVWRSRPSG